MNKRAAVLPSAAISKEIEGVTRDRNREPNPNRGQGDWESFTRQTQDNRYRDLLTIPDLHFRRQDMAVANNPDKYLFTDRILVFWVSAAEKSTDPNVVSIEIEMEMEFAELAKRWHDETSYLSSPSRITGNDTYLKIISMGKQVIPLILEDLKGHGGDWYRALRILSGDDPVPEEARGDVDKMKELWLSWGRERGYIK